MSHLEEIKARWLKKKDISYMHVVNMDADQQWADVNFLLKKIDRLQYQVDLDIAETRDRADRREP